MFFTELVWHNILEFRYGKRPFGFWDWKNTVHNVLKQIKDEYYPKYYWSSHHRHIYDGSDSSVLDYTMYTVLTYGPQQSNWRTSIKPIKYIFKDKKYFEEFKRTLLWWNISHAIYSS